LEKKKGERGGRKTAAVFSFKSEKKMPRAQKRAKGGDCRIPTNPKRQSEPEWNLYTPMKKGGISIYSEKEKKGSRIHVNQKRKKPTAPQGNQTRVQRKLRSRRKDGEKPSYKETKEGQKSEKKQQRSRALPRFGKGEEKGKSCGKRGVGSKSKSP